MMQRELDWPEFAREALDAETRGNQELLEALSLLPSLLEPSPGTDGRALMQRVEALPLRYAPFFSALTRLWDLSERDVLSELARAAEPSAWKKPGLPGLRVVDISAGPRLRGARVTLARFARGLTFPKHLHHGYEALLVLEGHYRDQSGRQVGPGDLHEMNAGSEHFFRVGKDEPCVAASVQFGMQFSGPLMKILVKLFG